MAITAINPATGEPLETYPEVSADDAQQVVARAAHAFEAWRCLRLEERATCLRRIAQRLRERQAQYAELMAREMGKPVVQGRSEVEKCAWACEYYAAETARLLTPETIATDATKSYVVFEPLGVILAVMPWNFPFWQVFRAAAPALMAGNTLVLKHASNVPGCAQAIAQLFTEAGCPAGVLSLLLVGSHDVPALIAHPAVRAVTLTGSTPAGQAVASLAGQHLKKTVLELGGSDPYLVLADADMEAAAEACVASRLVNTGQSCIAAKRFIVVEPARRQFEMLVVRHMQARIMGDPLREDVTLGPLARSELRDTLHAQVQRSVQAGARLLLGGEIPSGQGAFYPATVLTEVRPGMPAFDEETFGPVAAIIPVSDEAAAIRAANASPFGLGAAIFTRDAARGERLARQLEVGQCFINALVRSDPRLPFGGVKLSGYGRELGSFGLREFVNIKTVYVK